MEQVSVRLMLLDWLDQNGQEVKIVERCLLSLDPMLVEKVIVFAMSHPHNLVCDRLFLEVSETLTCNRHVEARVVF